MELADNWRTISRSSKDFAYRPPVSRNFALGVRQLADDFLGLFLSLPRGH